MNLKFSQSGFSALDTVLAVVLVAAICASGYIAYQTMHDNGQGSPTASVSPLPHATPSPTPVNGVLAFSQFGVKMTVPSGLAGLTYTYSPAKTSKDATGKDYTNPALVNLISPQLKGQKTACFGGPSLDGNIGSISRDTAAPMNMDGTLMTLPNPSVKKIGDYYYQLGLPNGDCFQGTSLEQTEASDRTLLQQAFPSLTQ